MVDDDGEQQVVTAVVGHQGREVRAYDEHLMLEQPDYCDDDDFR